VFLALSFGKRYLMLRKRQVAKIEEVTSVIETTWLDFLKK
jgi:hypothetical protein